MTRDDVIRMAREAGATPYTNRHYPDRPTHTFNPEQLERFAALVAAAEREACAKLVAQTEAWRSKGWVSTLCPHTKDAIAAAIRQHLETNK